MNNKMQQLILLTLIIAFINLIFFSGLFCYQMLNGIYDEFGLMLWVTSLVFFFMNFIALSITN